MMKSAIRRVLRSAGYEVRRLPMVPQPTRAYPFVTQVSLAGVEFSFWVKDATAEQWYPPEGHEKLVETQLLADLVSPGDRVLEVGCHHGFYLPFFSKLVGANGFVLGVDINPENVMIAQAQLALNGLPGHCEVLHRAASASAEGHLPYSDSTNSLVVLSGEERGGTAQSTTVDHLCSLYGDFDVLMIDVEGFEEEVLKGARGLLERMRPKLTVEIHSDNLQRYGATLESVALAGLFSDYAGKMVLRSIDRNKDLPFQVDALPTDGIANVFLTRLS
jgi:FkbM family methyltransferase